MEGTRLMERIRAMARDPDDRSNQDVETLQSSVLNHLARLLNTRQGSSIISRDYGVPDFSSLCTTPNTSNIHRIEEILSDVVRRYEPRLKNPVVRFAKDDKDSLKMNFKLSAELANVPDGENTVYFQTVLTPNGRISIRRHVEEA